MDRNSEQDKTFSTNEGFVYNVVVDKSCELFSAEPYRSQLPNVGEISIDSEWFGDHRHCQDDVARLLVSFSHQLRQITGKRYVIATKYNPMHDEDADEVEDLGFGPWEERDVLKMYLADAERLKNENAIDCSVTAVIRADLKVKLDSAHTLFPQ